MSTDNAVAEIPTNTDVADATSTVVANASDEDFNDVASAGQYLPRLTLYTFTSRPTQDGLIKAGQFGYAQGNAIIDVGNEIQLILLGSRVKALDLSTDEVISYFTKTHPEFQRIKEMSTIKDSSCMCGPEFLVYLPTHKIFATFFMSSPTMKKEAPNVNIFLKQNKNITMRSKLIQTPKFKWHGPVVVECSMVLTPPDAAKAQAEVIKFKSEKDYEKVTQAVSDRKR